MKRLILIDFMKGIFILCVILIHSLGFNVLEDVNFTIDSLPLGLAIIAYPMGVLGTWTGFFCLTSGVLLSYIIHHQLSEKKSISSIIRSFTLKSSGILISHYLYVIFFIHPPFYFSSYHSLITGSLRLGVFTNFSTELLFFSSSLLGIALSVLLTGFIILLFWFMNGKKIDRKIYGFLLIVAVIILCISPTLVEKLTPLIHYEISPANFVFSTLLSWFIGPRFPAFPMLSYTLIGAIFGIILAEKESWHFIKYLGISIGVISIAISLFLIPFLGIPDYDVAVIGVNLNFLNIGIMTLILTLGIWVFELKTYKQKVKLVNKTTWVRRFGMFTLTIFLFEPLIGILVAKFYDYLFPGLIHNIVFGVIVYIPTLILIWSMILRLWEKFDYRFTIEWIYGKIFGKIRGYKSEKTNWRKNLFNPIS
jgi:hypothetical protein